jgi:hypothetical protein
MVYSDEVSPDWPIIRVTARHDPQPIQMECTENPDPGLFGVPERGRSLEVIHPANGENEINFFHSGVRRIESFSVTPGQSLLDLLSISPKSCSGLRT